MKKYVDVEALIKELESKRLVFDDPVNFKEAQIRADALKKQGDVIRETIENFPAADVVEVVRCRDESKDQENKPFNDLYNAFVERSKR